MKLLMENWNKFLNEEPEDLEEGPLASALGGLGLALGVGGTAPDIQDAPEPAPTHQVATQEVPADAAAELEINKLKTNEDGTYSITIELPDHVKKLTMRSMMQSVGGTYARSALLSALTGNPNGSISARVVFLDAAGNPSGASPAAMYATATGTVK